MSGEKSGNGPEKTVWLLSPVTVRSLCGMGEGEACCSFLLAGADGFECAKAPGNEGFRRTLESRRAAGTMVAKADRCSGPPAFKVNP